MKKLVIVMLSLLFSISVPLYASAAYGGGEKGACNTSCEKHMGHGRGMGKGMDGWRGGFGRGGHEMMFRLPEFYLSHSKDLKLSDEQKASLKKISFELRKDMIAKGADMKVKKLEMKELLARPDYKLEDANAKLKELADSRLALASTLLTYSVKSRDVLTPDQLKEAAELRGHGKCGKCDKCKDRGMRRRMADNEDEE